MIDDALRASLVTVLRNSFPGPRDDARDRELGEVADTVAGVVRRHDGAKVVGLRGTLENHARVATPSWEDPRRAAQHFPAGR